MGEIVNALLAGKTYECDNCLEPYKRVSVWVGNYHHWECRCCDRCEHQTYQLVARLEYR